MAEVETRASGGESAKRKHIVWNEENLSYNEANKSVRAAPEPATASPRMPRPQPPFFSHARVPETLRTDRPTLRPPPHRVSQAKMKIDEPDTPGRALLRSSSEDPEHDGADVVAAMDDVADRLKAIDAEAGGPGDAGPSGPSRVELKGEWDSSDDEDDEDEARRRQKLAFPDPGGSGGSAGPGTPNRATKTKTRGDRRRGPRAQGEAVRGAAEEPSVHVQRDDGEGTRTVGRGRR